MTWKQLGEVSLSKVESKSAAEQGLQNNPTANVGESNKLLVPGVGKISYATKRLHPKTDDWLKMVNARTTIYSAPIEAQIEARDEANAWAATEVYYGADGRILRIAINKGTFDTFPLDDVAIRDMQEIHGMAIVKIGYPDDLIESGYNNEDFIAATKDHWDRFGTDFECEITPVVVKVVPITRTKGYSETNPYSKYMGQEFPMILVKTGRNHQRDDAGFITGTFIDEFSHSESVFRAWGLDPYVPMEEDGKMVLPKIGAFAVHREPLMEAWKKRQVKSERNK
jgi:hypothetical protein